MSIRTKKQIKNDINTIFPKIDSDSKSLTEKVKNLKAFSQGANNSGGPASQVKLQAATQKYQQCIQAFSTLQESYRYTNAFNTTPQNPNNKDLNNLIPKIKSDIKNFSRELAQLESCTQELKSAGADKQRVNVDLQNAFQKQEQLCRMMSDTLKKMHETSQIIIRNLG
jgi:Skp family chaperone for outer membrane proteins